MNIIIKGYGMKNETMSLPRGYAISGQIVHRADQSAFLRCIITCERFI